MDSLTADEIRELREAAGLTHAEAAELLGVTKRAWQYWENDKRSPSPQTCELIRIKLKSKKKK